MKFLRWLFSGHDPNYNKALDMYRRELARQREEEERR